MKKLTRMVKIVSRTGKIAHIISIDLEAKTVKINTDKGIKVITFLTAAAYKTASGLLNLSEKNLNLILEDDIENAPETITEAEENTPESGEENIPYGPFTTSKVNSSEDLKYIPDLATIIGCTQKNLRKRLRKLEAEGFIIKVAHTWCWDSETLESIVAMLNDKVDTSKDPHNAATYSSEQN